MTGSPFGESKWDILKMLAFFAFVAPVITAKEAVREQIKMWRGCKEVCRTSCEWFSFKGCGLGLDKKKK